MMASRLLVVGNDKIGRQLLARVQGVDNLALAVDASTDWRRVFRLVRRGQLKLSWLIRMAWAELGRPAAPIADVPAIRTNQDLRAFIDRGVRQIFLFRAGLIVNRTVIESGAEILNLHCAALPAYSGVGAIARALRDGAFEQTATLHRVTERIDGGEVIATMPYRLEADRGYRANEDAAYTAGESLLLAQLRTPASGPQPGP